MADSRGYSFIRTFSSQFNSDGRNLNTVEGKTLLN
jgi:hypothetical protein